MLYTDYYLDLSQITSGNRQIFERAKRQYQLPSHLEMREIINKIELDKFPDDYSNLLSQIKNKLSECKISANQGILKTINEAMTTDDYKKIKNILSTRLDTSQPKIYGELIPKIVELNNIHRLFEHLNNLPGIDGKSVNIFNLKDLE